MNNYEIFVIALFAMVWAGSVILNINHYRKQLLIMEIDRIERKKWKKLLKKKYKFKKKK